MRTIYEIENDIARNKEEFTQRRDEQVRNKYELLTRLSAATTKEESGEIQLKLRDNRKAMSEAQDRYTETAANLSEELVAAKKFYRPETSPRKPLSIITDPHRDWVQWGWDGKEIWQLAGGSTKWQPARKIHLTPKRIQAFYELVIGE